MEFRYNPSFQPPAPMLRVGISAPQGQGVIQLQALIDTGSDISILPESVIEGLGIIRAGTVELEGYDGETTEATAFIVRVSLLTGRQWSVAVVAWSQSHGLIGRNLLNHWRLTLDGPKGIVTIE